MRWLNCEKISLIFVGFAISGFMSLASVSLAAEGTWIRKADMPTGRLWHASSVVDDKIYVIGGRATETLTTEYYPLTNAWTTKTPMPTARFAHSTSVVDGKIYVIGGVSAAYTSGLSIVEEYDPVTDNWTTKTPMPTARFAHSTSVVDGKIYVIGGTASSSFWAGFRRTVEVYDPLTDTWTSKADMPTARIFFSTSVVDGKIYAIGGVLVTKAGLSTVEVYDPATDTWTTKTPMPTARHAHASAVVDGKIYVIGGGPEGGADHTGPDALSVVEAYDPATDTWTTKADLPEPRGLLSANAVGGKIYAIGGKTTTKNPHPPGLSTVYEYDTGLGVLPADFNGDGVVDINDLVILIECWGTDDPLCDIAPEPSGDGVVDILDLELFMSYWGQKFLPSDLIAYWRFDETEGDIAYDSVGKHDGAIIGDPIWQPEGGMVDGALEFDGQDDYVTTGLVLDPSTFGPISVFAWIKGGAPGQVIISQRNGVNWLKADPSDGKLMTALSRPAGGRIPPVPLVSELIITDNTWHLIGFFWDGLYRHLYVDGSEVARDAASLSGLQSAQGVLYLGVGSTLAPDTFFSGLIDDVRIYNRAIQP